MSAPPPAPAPEEQWSVPPRRRRRRWVVVLVSVLAAILVVIGVGTALFVSNTYPAYSAAHDFVEDLVEGREEAAIRQLCRAAQDRPDAAVTSVQRTFGFLSTISVNPFTVDREGTRATVEYQVEPGDGGEERVFELPMREERGDWKPCPAPR